MQQEMSLLVQARMAWRQGALPAAQALYLRHLAIHPNDPQAQQELAGVFFGAGRYAEAESVLDRALQVAPASPDLRFNRALARQAQGRTVAALADLDALLSAVPAHVSGRLQRGALRFHSGDNMGALADFQSVSELAPGDVEGHFNAGLVLLRLGRGEEALQRLSRSVSLAPDHPAVLRAFGNALRETGDLAQSMARIRESLALDADNAITHGDYGLSQLAAGLAVEAIASFGRALELDPSDQTALAGLYLAHNESGGHAEVAMLMDESLCAKTRLQLESPDALREAVLTHSALHWEPSGRTTRKGEQTAFLDLTPGSPFAGLAAQVAEMIQARLQALANTPALSGHPWLRGSPARWRLNMWATVLRDAGHQAPHIHPAGWMSGVYYLDDGDADVADGGAILFGRGSDELGLRMPQREWSHQPRTGDLLLFPSYFYHRTLPFHGKGTRISLAFDMVPA